MLLFKYAPKTAKEIIGNHAAIREIAGWLHSWTRGALLIHGPPGTGKTTALRLVAKENGYEVLEIHGDDKVPLAEIKAASSQRSIFGKRKIILIENIEGTAMRVSQIVKEASCPVVCTSMDMYKLTPAVRKLFKTVKFEKVNDADIVSFAKKICSDESLTISDRTLSQLARMANGDLRAFLIDLELACKAGKPGYRNFEENVFNTIKLIFKTTSIDNARIVMENSEKDAQEIFPWLESNIIEEYSDIESIAKAYDYLSKADVFASRVLRRQAWSLQKYASDLAVYGTSLSGTSSPRFIAYRPPFYFRTSPAVLVKIASNLHTSVAGARSYVPLLKMLGPLACEEIGLDEDETDAVLSRK